jgi:hypothetical protein
VIESIPRRSRCRSAFSPLQLDSKNRPTAPFVRQNLLVAKGPWARIWAIGLEHDSVIRDNQARSEECRKEQPATPDSLSDSLEQRISDDRSRVLEIALSSPFALCDPSEYEVATGKKSSGRSMEKGRCGIDLSLRVEGTTGAEIMTYGTRRPWPMLQANLTRRSQVRAPSKLSGWPRPWTRGPPKVPQPCELKLC